MLRETFTQSHSEETQRHTEKNREDDEPAGGRDLAGLNERTEQIIGAEVDQITPVHQAPMFSYLRLSKGKIGLLLNFNPNGCNGHRINVHRRKINVHGRRINVHQYLSVPLRVFSA
jgi:hypothetical protein